MSQPPPSPTLQLVLVFTVPVYQFFSLKKMHCLFFCMCIVLGISFIAMNIKTAKVTKVMYGTQQKLIPRGPVVDPDVIVKPKEAWNHKQLVNNMHHKPTCRTSFVHVLITSAAYHFTERGVIRQTWCSKSQHIKSFLPYNSSSLIQCTFLIGQSNDAKTMQSVKEEIANYDDVLLGGYVDTYRNLTLKVLTGLHWVTIDCISKYVLKTDDDCFINSNILLKVLLSQPEALSFKPLYVGLTMDSLEHTIVIRDPDSKWSVTSDQYAPDYYPTYISGTGYLLSQSAASKIFELSKLFEPFPVEDAYIGVLAEYARILPQNSYRFTLIREKWRTCNFLYLILIHHISATTQREFQKLVKTAYKTCDHSDLTMNW